MKACDACTAECRWQVGPTTHCAAAPTAAASWCSPCSESAGKLLASPLTFFVGAAFLGCLGCCCRIWSLPLCTAFGRDALRGRVELLLLLLLPPRPLLLVLDLPRGVLLRLAIAALIAAVVFAMYSGSCQSRLLRSEIAALRTSSSSLVVFCRHSTQGGVKLQPTWQQALVHWASSQIGSSWPTATPPYAVCLAWHYCHALCLAAHKQHGFGLWQPPQLLLHTAACVEPRSPAAS